MKFGPSWQAKHCRYVERNIIGYMGEEEDLNHQVPKKAEVTYYYGMI